MLGTTGKGVVPVRDARKPWPVWRSFAIAITLAVIVIAAPHRFAANPALDAAPVPSVEGEHAPADDASSVPPPEAAPRPAGPAKDQGPSRVAVLIYHQIDPDGEGLYSLNPERLRADLQWLLAEGWRPLTFEQFRGWYSRAEVVPGKAFLLTFDDGYEAMARSAMPVLRELAVPAVVFLETGRLGRGTGMCAESAAALAESGLVSLQCHTHALHYEAPGGPDGRRQAAVQLVPGDAIVADLEQCVAVVRDLAGTDPAAIAWPYGVTSGAALEAAADLFELQFGTQEGYVVQGRGDAMIPRFGLDWRTHTQVKKLFRSR